MDMKNNGLLLAALLWGLFTPASLVAAVREQISLDAGWRFQCDAVKTAVSNAVAGLSVQNRRLARNHG